MGLFSRKKAPIRDNECDFLLEVEEENPWTLHSISHEQAQVLLEACVNEIKSRGLDIPLCFLPFRPSSDHSAVQLLVRNYFLGEIRGPSLIHDLKTSDCLVLMGVVRWVVCRLEGGLISFDEYILFLKAEQQLNYSLDAFSILFPAIVVDLERRRNYNNFFELLTAIASHARDNGLPGRKLSRIAAGLIFHQIPSKRPTQRFDEGYRLWQTAANAAEHLFMAWIRDRSSHRVSGISMIPMSIQKLVDQTLYPLTSTSVSQGHEEALNITLNVDDVSQTPSALLQRVLMYKDKIQEVILYEMADVNSDAENSLTEECLNVFRGIGAVNAEHCERQANSAQDAAWMKFSEHGFDSTTATTSKPLDSTPRRANRRVSQISHASIESQNHAKDNKCPRPITPDWSQFIDAGFGEDVQDFARIAPMHLHLPHVASPCPRALPALTFRGFCAVAEKRRMQLDDAIWGAWICSLASENNSLLKGFFGRTIILQTQQREGWLIIEEVVRGSDMKTGARSVKSMAPDWSRTRLPRKLSVVRIDPPGPIIRDPLKAAQARVKSVLSNKLITSGQVTQTVPYNSLGTVLCDARESGQHERKLSRYSLNGDALAAMMWPQMCDHGASAQVRSSIYPLMSPDDAAQVLKSEPCVPLRSMSRSYKPQPTSLTRSSSNDPDGFSSQRKPSRLLSFLRNKRHPVSPKKSTQSANTDGSTAPADELTSFRYPSRDDTPPKGSSIHTPSFTSTPKSRHRNSCSVREEPAVHGGDAVICSSPAVSSLSELAIPTLPQVHRKSGSRIDDRTSSAESKAEYSCSEDSIILHASVGKTVRVYSPWNHNSDSAVALLDTSSSKNDNLRPALPWLDKRAALSSTSLISMDVQPRSFLMTSNVPSRLPASRQTSPKSAVCNLQDPANQPVLCIPTTATSAFQERSDRPLPLLQPVPEQISVVLTRNPSNHAASSQSIQVLSQKAFLQQHVTHRQPFPGQPSTQAREDAGHPGPSKPPVRPMRSNLRWDELRAAAARANLGTTETRRKMFASLPISPSDSIPTSSQTQCQFLPSDLLPPPPPPPPDSPLPPPPATLLPALEIKVEGTSSIPSKSRANRYLDTNSKSLEDRMLKIREHIRSIADDGSDRDDDDASVYSSTSTS